jgi:citrate lyase beta subunit
VLNYPPAILVVPAHKPNWHDVARESGAWIMWDLEDGVPESYKDSARENLSALAGVWDLVRVNSGARFAADMESVERVGAIPVIPKAEIGLVSLGCGVVLESASAILNADKILDAVKPPVVLFGWADLLASTGLTPSCSEFLSACKARVVLCSKALGIPVYDGPALDRPAEAARKARSSGFTGMGCINPMQVPVVTREFRRAREEDARFLSRLMVYDNVPPPLHRISNNIWALNAR